MNLLVPALLTCCLAAQAPLLPLQERLRLDALAAAEAHVASQADSAQGAGAWTFQVVAPVALPAHLGPSPRVEFSHLSRKELGGRFFAAFRILDGARLVGTARVDLEGTWKGTVLQAKAMLPRKSVPQAEQLEEVPFEGTPPAGFLQAIPVGHRLRNAVPLGKVLTRMDIEPIPLVAAGDRVRLELVSGSLVIATEALARTQGALGDRVRLELPSRKQVQGVITGEGEARMQWR